MKLYSCGHCKNPLYFENNICLVCGNPAGFDANRLTMITLIEKGSGQIADINAQGYTYRQCANAAHGTCNWLIAASDPSIFCRACQLNRVIPVLTDPDNMDRWNRIEIAKHRLVYALLRLGLPVFPKPVTAGDAGIAFDFMANVSQHERVLTGHDNGVITLNIEEADEAERVRNKRDLGEKYRTLLGHFRHEIGHYYWDMLISGRPAIEEYRRLFGDERADYGEALKTYYLHGAAADWAAHFISPYASAHPWEDWAETWSHYMHMMDTLETAYAFGIGVHASRQRSLQTEIREDPYELADFDTILQMWLPLTFAVNSLNRSMGHPDFYPFVISTPVIAKLKFIHRIAGAGRQTQ